MEFLLVPALVDKLALATPWLDSVLGLALEAGAAHLHAMDPRCDPRQSLRTILHDLDTCRLRAHLSALWASAWQGLAHLELHAAERLRSTVAQKFRPCHSMAGCGKRGMPVDWRPLPGAAGELALQINDPLILGDFAKFNDRCREHLIGRAHC